MSKVARRPHPVVALTVGLAVALAVVLSHQASQAADGAPAQERSYDELVADGRELYVTGCSSCHGLNGTGIITADGEVQGPPLINSGEAAAYFYLHTGRMPLNASDAIPVRKEPAYNEDEIEALVAYVGSLGVGPAIPPVDIEDADLAEGGVIYRDQCQACHSATGAGGALSYGRNAPSLSEANPLEVSTAVRIGPGPMPRFGIAEISPEELDDVAAYVEYLRSPDDQGGVSLGRLGPIPEGFLIWVLGIGGMLLVAVWIGRQRSQRRARTSREAA